MSFAAERRRAVILALVVALSLRSAEALGLLARSSPGRWTGRRCGFLTTAMAAGGVAPDYDPLVRIGHGYDIHKLAPMDEAGQPLVIGGVSFDGSDAPSYELGCVAHSDGDVIYNSVVDAILGALSMPDIGQLFPDNDPRLRGADSSIVGRWDHRSSNSSCRNDGKLTDSSTTILTNFCKIRISI